MARGSEQAKPVVAALAEVVRRGPVSRRGWAAMALGEFGPDALEAVPVLIGLLKDAPPDDKFWCQSSAASAIGKIAADTPAAEQAIAALVGVLESKSSLPRAKAIEALGRFGPTAAVAIPKIRALKTDRDPEIRDAVIKALPKIEK